MKSGMNNITGGIYPHSLTEQNYTMARKVKQQIFFRDNKKFVKYSFKKQVKKNNEKIMKFDFCKKSLAKYSLRFVISSSMQARSAL